MRCFDKHSLRDDERHASALQVLFAGSPEQVQQVVESAEPFKEDLVQRGVLLVSLQFK